MGQRIDTRGQRCSGPATGDWRGFGVAGTGPGTSGICWALCLPLLGWSLRDAPPSPIAESVYTVQLPSQEFRAYSYVFSAEAAGNVEKAVETGQCGRPIAVSQSVSQGTLALWDHQVNLGGLK